MNIYIPILRFMVETHSKNLKPVNTALSATWSMCCC